MIRMVVALIAAALGAFGAPSFAQEWPSKSIRIISPFAPGGGSDTLGRILAGHLSEKLGKQFLIENRGGAGGIVGTAVAAKADPDGYTFVISSIATHVIAPATNPNTGYDSLRSFSHVAYIGGPPTVIVVHPSLGVTTFKELVTLVKSGAPPLAYGSPGPGTLGNLLAEFWAQKENVKLSHISYKGAGQAVGDLVAGHVKMGSVTLTAVLGQLRAGVLIPLAVSSANRLAEFPNVPTLRELGYPDLVAITWFAIAAPAGVPNAIVQRMNQEIIKAIDNPAVRQRFNAEEIESEKMSPEELTRFVESEMAKWIPIAKMAMASHSAK